MISHGAVQISREIRIAGFETKLAGDLCSARRLEHVAGAAHAVVKRPALAGTCFDDRRLVPIGSA